MNINEVVSDFQIIGHSIKALELHNSFLFFGSDDDSIQREFLASYDLGDPFDMESEENSIGGVVTLYLDVNIYNEEATATIHLELEGGFLLNNSKDEELLKSMLSINGTAALYSIGRGIISGITSQMALDGSGTIMLPMINTFELNNALREEAESNEE